MEFRSLGALVSDRAGIVRDGGDPDLSRSESDRFTFFILEFDLLSLGSFGPGTFDGAAILKNVSFAGTDGGNVLMIAIGGGMLLDHHRDDDFGGELGGGTAILLRSQGICGAIIRGVGGAIGVGAKIGIGGGVVNVINIEIWAPAEFERDILGEWYGVFFGVGGFLVFLCELGGLFGLQTSEPGGV